MLVVMRSGVSQRHSSKVDMLGGILSERELKESCRKMRLLVI